LIDIYKLICDTLFTLGYPVREQGTFGENEAFPETFITYQIIDSPNAGYADNLPTSTIEKVQFTLYSKKPALKQSADNLFKSVLLPAGFLRVGGRDLTFNKDTGHYAFTSDYKFYESEV
jgi:hypothetical protein